MLTRLIYNTIMSLPYTVVDGLAVPHYPRLHRLGYNLIMKMDPLFSDG